MADVRIYRQNNYFIIADDATGDWTKDDIEAWYPVEMDKYKVV